ncbi:MAG: hypothetical protein CMI32_04160 [Opitutales bacterium]|jgi:hypothetical protein|nr:hypothetical protein [Opitutales bacterium]|tara:strand:- start:399 stop:668 length:270 start_codon:yes stop_codon:yes gene_type:complete
MEGVSELWEQLEASPLLLWVAGVLALFLAVGIIKRVLIISVLSGVLLLLYFIYVTNFQERFPLPEIDLEEIQERWDSGDEANASAEVSP